MVDIHAARTALYRFYDAEDVLLYVGITNMPNVRWAAHALKPWWKQVARKEVAWFDNRAQAERAETLAIRDERPAYNVAKSPWRSTAEPPALSDLPVGLDGLDLEIAEAARQRLAFKAELEEAEEELRVLLVKGRAAGLGPSQMGKLTGFTREWVAKIAPDPQAAAKRDAMVRRMRKSSES